MFYKNLSKSLFTYLLTHLLLVIVIVPAAATSKPFDSNPLDASGKVIVCHMPGMPHQKMIEIDEVDLEDHLAHGDLVGQCVPLQETVAYDCNVSDVEYQTLYVSSEAWGAQKGTKEWPFRSVSSALKFAEKMDFPGVELQIGPGVYGDDMAVLSRPTRIVGPGQSENPSAELSLSIINDGAYELGIQGVVFRAANSGPAITVTHSAADTAICDIRFENVVGYALSQNGGTVYIEGGIFNSTARDPGANSDDHLTGTAIVLTGGVTGSINDIHVDESSGSGLHASGTGTKVDVDWDGLSQSVLENGTGCLGALVVHDGAELNASRLTLDGNRIRGILVEGNGTRVNFPFLAVTSTRHLEGGPDVTQETCGFNGIFGVVARSGAALNIMGTSSDPFIISDSDVGGLVLNDIDVSESSLSDGIIRNNLIGLYINPGSTPCQTFWEEFSIDRVLFQNNDVNIDAPCLLPPAPLPELFCNDGIDNDGDGLVDHDDPDCEGAPGG